ncbi:MAG: PIN domain-containing protein [Planctomycetota bacterium]
MAPGEQTEPVRVCLDADVVIAGLFSRTGASHAILILGEIGLMHLVLPQAAVNEVRRNLQEKLPEALPHLDQFLRAVAVEVCRPTPGDRKQARRLAHDKDVPIMAAALSSGAAFLVTHNTRHFKSTEHVRVVRPRKLIEEARAWMARFGE